MTIELQNIQLLFPTPLLTFRAGNAPALNRDLVAEIERRRQTEAGASRSNRLGWHSASDLFGRKEPAHSQLAALIRDACGEAVAKLAPGLDLAAVKAIYEGWVNVSPRGSYNRPHHHPGNLLSGVYYVATPEPAPADPVAGRIEFINPRASLNDDLVEALFTAPSATVRPEPGMLLIFPANVLHWVHPNAADEDRITIAFNLRFEARAKPSRSKPTASRRGTR